MRANVRRLVAAASERRLTDAPDRFGTPLRGTRKGDWKRRSGDYWVVYTIGGREVPILAIRHRSAIYTDVVARLPRGTGK